VLGAQRAGRGRASQARPRVRAPYSCTRARGPRISQLWWCQPRWLAVLARMHLVAGDVRRTGVPCAVDAAEGDAVFPLVHSDIAFN
jgi:hypothetical protein